MGALSAARSVRIWTCYFVPDQPMIAALSTAALRSARIECDARKRRPSHGAMGARATTGRCWSTVYRIFERPGPFDHSKLMLVDGQWCCLGSANWDARSLRLNFEFNVGVRRHPRCLRG